SAHIRGAANVHAEIQGLKKDIDQIEKAIQKGSALLENADFCQRAPQEVLESTRAKMVERQLERKTLVSRLRELEKSSGAAT
ncbi:MAG: hypothetical protein WB813_00715, partial [Candidatus Acidiferrales bacterium]